MYVVGLWDSGHGFRHYWDLEHGDTELWRIRAFSMQLVVSAALLDVAHCTIVQFVA